MAPKSNKQDNKPTVSQNKARIAANAQAGLQQWTANRAANTAAIASGGVGGTRGSSMPAGYSYSGPKQTNFANAGANISKNEALKIAKGKDISVSEVMDRALGKGRTLGASLVNQYNVGKLDDRSVNQRGLDYQLGKMGAGPMYQPKSLSQLNTFGKMPKGSVYGGKTSTGIPILGTKMPKDLVNKNPRGGMTASTTGSGMAATGGSGTAAGQEVLTPELPLEAEKQPDINIDFPTTGSEIFSTATGFRTKKSSRGRRGAPAQGPTSQRVTPTGGWQYNVG